MHFHSPCGIVLVFSLFLCFDEIKEMGMRDGLCSNN